MIALLSAAIGIVVVRNSRQFKHSKVAENRPPADLRLVGQLPGRAAPAAPQHRCQARQSVGSADIRASLPVLPKRGDNHLSPVKDFFQAFFSDVSLVPVGCNGAGIVPASDPSASKNAIAASRSRRPLSEPGFTH